MTASADAADRPAFDAQHLSLPHGCRARARRLPGHPATDGARAAAGDPRAPRLILAPQCLPSCSWYVVTGRIRLHAWAGIRSLAAARAIESCHGPIYNRYVDGGPIIYFAPRQHVMIDSRQDPYPTWLVQADGDIEMTGEDPGTLFRRLAINCAAVPPSALVATHLRRDGWTVRHIDERWTGAETPCQSETPAGDRSAPAYSLLRNGVAAAGPPATRRHAQEHDAHDRDRQLKPRHRSRGAKQW